MGRWNRQKDPLVVKKMTVTLEKRGDEPGSELLSIVLWNSGQGNTQNLGCLEQKEPGNAKTADSVHSRELAPDAIRPRSLRSFPWLPSITLAGYPGSSVPGAELRRNSAILHFSGLQCETGILYRDPWLAQFPLLIVTSGWQPEGFEPLP